MTGFQHQFGFMNGVVAAFQAGNTIINSAGMFSYFPNPGPNNLVVSTGTNSAGVDGFGNQYVAGDAQYGMFLGTWYAMQENAAGLTWNIGGATQATPYGPTVGMSQFALNPGGPLFQPVIRMGGSIAFGDQGLGGQIREIWLQPSGDTTGASDSSAIANALAALLPNGKLHFLEGLFWINAPIKLPNNTEITSFNTRPAKSRSTSPTATITVANGANLDAIITDTIFTAGGLVPSGSTGIMVNGIVIDGNAANQTGGLGHGIAFIGNASGMVENCVVRNTRGDGILNADQNAAGNNYTGGSGLTDFYIQFCTLYQIGGHGFHIQANTSKLTDGMIQHCIQDNNFLAGTGFIVFAERASGLRLRDIHGYANVNSGFIINSCSGSWIEDLYADNVGQAGLAATTYYGIKIQLSPFGTTILSGNKVAIDESNTHGGAGAGNYVYYNVSHQSPGAGQQNSISWQPNNTARQVAAGTGSHLAYNVDATTSGNLWITGITSVNLTETLGSTNAAAVMTTAGAVTFH